jgi:photosystem II stability/assembly factor-like uncharacterized protein
MIKVLSVLVVFFVSFQLNAQWVSQASGVSADLISVSAVDNNVCWIGGHDGVVLRTTNGGTTWTNVGGGSVIGTINRAENVYALDANTCLAAMLSSSGTYVYRTSNGGSNWAQVFAQNNGGTSAVQMTSATDGFMVGDPVNSRWSLWKTSDGGASWDSTGLYLKASGNEYGWANLFINGSNIWFGTNNSRIYYSSDDGVTWTAQTTPLLNIYGLSFSGNIGIAGGSTSAGDGAISISSDNGTTWTPGPFSGSGPAANCATQGNNFIYSTFTGAIYLSTNSGVSFQKEDSVSGSEYYNVKIARTGNSVWACGVGGIIRKGTTTLTAINDMKPVVQRFSLEQNYPNPFNPSTSIKYNIAKPGLVKIDVYNTLGQRVKELVNEVKESGSYNISFNSSSISSGIYFYNIETPQFSQVKKMIILK